MTLEEELKAARKAFTEAFNGVSDAFIRFSLAANTLTETIKQIEEHNRTLFEQENIS